MRTLQAAPCPAMTGQPHRPMDRPSSGPTVPPIIGGPIGGPSEPSPTEPAARTVGSAPSTLKWTASDGAQHSGKRRRSTQHNGTTDSNDGRRERPDGQPAERDAHSSVRGPIGHSPCPATRRTARRQSSNDYRVNPGTPRVTSGAGLRPRHPPPDPLAQYTRIFRLSCLVAWLRSWIAVGA